MKAISIIPEKRADGLPAFRAVAGDRQTCGESAGAALDALTLQLSPEESDLLVVIQSQRPDAFFGEDRQRRLKDLMDVWRRARADGGGLSEVEQCELEGLVDEELKASGERANRLSGELGA
ncbi:MAG: hypothetical protein KF833_16245 [Verrucomicrobiae bacterium]|nr:hypothetical protein [Verrucomicrobiae bacterium]